MSRRITGLETEYGCLIDPGLDARETLESLRNWLFENHRYGLIDQHDRDWDEPAGNGGFLFNGGRIYIDMGHMEYCTAECVTVADVVRYDRAGDVLLLEATRALGLEDRVQFIRNNVDHHTGATFGCHENYSLERKAPLHEKNVLSLLAFLTLRILFTGAGRVGSMRSRTMHSGSPVDDEPVHFQISQRADYIQNDFFEWVQHNRAIINTRDEPLADARLFRRLHLIHGDTNVQPASLFLKVGTTRLVLDLLDADDMPMIVLNNAVTEFRQLSRTLSSPWRVRLGDDTWTDALELLELYRVKAHQLFAGRDAETDAILNLWEVAHRGLASDLNSLVGLVDWVSKEHLLRSFCEQEGIGWDHPWLESQDLEYHMIHPERSLGLALANVDGGWAPTGVAAACSDPPGNSRAATRSRLMREIVGRESQYMLDWDAVEIPNRKRTKLLDPFKV